MVPLAGLAVAAAMQSGHGAGLADALHCYLVWLRGGFRRLIVELYRKYFAECRHDHGAVTMIVPAWAQFGSEPA